MALDYRACGQHEDYALKLFEYNPWCKNGKTGYEQYYAELLEYWEKYYRLQDKETITEETVDGVNVKTITQTTIATWNYKEVENKNNLLYWLEFIDNNQTFEEISVKNIGQRTAVTQNDNITLLFEEPIPSICYVSSDTTHLHTVLNYPYY
jgi:hypothetical protein